MLPTRGSITQGMQQLPPRVQGTELVSQLPSGYQAPQAGEGTGAGKPPVRIAYWMDEFDRMDRGILGGLSLPFRAIARIPTRVFGFLRQLGEDPAEVLADPFAAWRAGDLFYTMTGDILGYENMAQARQNMAGGMPYREAIAEQLGSVPTTFARRAEALRNVGELLTDPINWMAILGIHGPISAARRTAGLARWGAGATPEMIAGARAAETAAFEAMDAARLAGRPADTAADLVQNAIRLSGELAEMEGRALTPWQRFSIWATGGMPMSTDDAARWAQNSSAVGMTDAFRAVIRGDWRRGARWGILPWNWFKLTPASAANEVLTNIQRYSQSMLSNAPNAAAMVARLDAAAEALTTGRLAGRAIGPGGRALEGWLALARTSADDIIRAYMSPDTQALTNDIAHLAALAGRTTDDFMAAIWRGESPQLFDAIRTATGAAPEGLQVAARVYGERLAAGELTAETLDALGRTFRNLPYSDGVFRVHLQTRLWDAVADTANRLFGVEAAGWWTKLTDSMKAVESLVYLRFNPGFYFRNVINNEVTVAVAGIYGRMGPEAIERLWARAGILDPRVFSGYSAMDIVPAREAAETAVLTVRRAMADSAEIIADARMPGQTWVQRIVDKISGAAGPLNMGQYAQQAETMASARAMTVGYMRGWAHYAVPGRGYSAIPETLQELIGPEGASYLRNSMNHAMNEQELMALVDAPGGLSRSIGAVLTDMEGRGYNVERLRGLLGHEELASIQDDLARALSSGDPEQVGSLFRTIREGFDNRIDRMLADVDRYSDTFVRVAAEGPGGLVDAYGGLLNRQASFMEAHFASLTDEVPRIQAIEDSVLRGAAWDAHMTNWNRYWSRYDDWARQTVRAMRDGAGEAGMELSDDFVGAMDEMLAGNRTFFEERQRVWRAFRQARREAPADAAAAMQTVWDQLDTAYQGLITIHRATMERLDAAIAAMIPDAQTQQLFNTARQVARDLRVQEMATIRDTYRNTAGLDRASRGAAFERLQAQRLAMLEEMEVANRLWRGVLQGDRATIEALSAVAPTGEAAQIALPVTGRTATFIPDLGRIVPEVQPLGETAMEVLMREGNSALLEMEQASLQALRNRPLRFSEAAQSGLRQYMDTVIGEMPTVRMASATYAASLRDAALLNYSRRTVFDTYMGHVMPFSFWTTHSMYNWMLRYVDQPVFFASYFRAQRAIAQANDSPSMPSRLRGFMPGIRIPGLPAWMGPVYINPLRTLFPINTLTDPIEQAWYAFFPDDARVERQIRAWADEGVIAQADADAALQSHEGPHWERAISSVRNGEDNWLDALSMLTSPHAPIMWAYNTARGRPAQPGPFMPITRTIKGITGLLGWPGGGLNIEALPREWLSLPTFDEYENYRAERQLVDMVAEGAVSLTDAMDAMNTHEGDLWEQAQGRAGQQYGISAVAGAFGLSAQGYPPGEEQSREAMQQMDEIRRLHDAGDEEAWNRFFEEHPEAEARLALNQTPEDRLRRYLTDRIWQTYWAMPDVNRHEAIEQLGPVFEQQFVNRETRSDSIDPQILAYWARMLNADVPESIAPPTLESLELTPPDVAWRIQVFYDARDQNFNWPAVREVQNEYFRLQPAARAAFRQQHPELPRYWSWRRDFLYRNPDLIDYMAENPEDYLYQSAEQYEEAVAGQPNFQWAEWYSYLGPNLASLVEDYASGEGLPAAAAERLAQIAESMGITPDVLLERLSSSIGLAQ